MCDYQKKMDVEEAVRKLHVLKSGVALWQRDRNAIETLLAAYYEQKKEITMLRAELYSVLMDISDLVTGDEKQAYMDGIQDAIETVSRHMEKFRSYDPDIQNSN